MGRTREKRCMYWRGEVMGEKEREGKKNRDACSERTVHKTENKKYMNSEKELFL